MDMDLIWEGHFEFEFILELVVNQYKVKWDDVRNNCYKKYCHNFDSDAVRKKEKNYQIRTIDTVNEDKTLLDSENFK